MRAKVIKKFRGAPDGAVYPQSYAPGDELEGGLARTMVTAGYAVEVKDAGAAPRNKAMAAAPQNKAAGQSAGTFPADTPAEPVARKGGGNRGRRAKPKKG